MSIEDRLSVLEEKVELLTRQLESPRKEDWTKRVIGSFANRPQFDEVLRLGREFRRQQNRIPGPEEADDEAEDRL